MVPVVWSLSDRNTCGPPVQAYSIHGEDGFWSDVSHLEPKNRYLFTCKKKIIGQNYSNNTTNLKKIENMHTEQLSKKKNYIPSDCVIPKKFIKTIVLENGIDKKIFRPQNNSVIQLWTRKMWKHN